MVKGEGDEWVIIPDSKVHVAHVGPTWVLLAPGGPHLGPVNFVIWDILLFYMAVIDYPCLDFNDAWIGCVFYVYVGGCEHAIK